jgi:hypothetical protein
MALARWRTSIGDVAFSWSLNFNISMTNQWACDFQSTGTHAPHPSHWHLRRFPYSRSILKSILRKLTGYSITSFEVTLGPWQFLPNNGELLVGKGLVNSYMTLLESSEPHVSFPLPPCARVFGVLCLFLIDLSSWIPIFKLVLVALHSSSFCHFPY